MSLQKHLCVYKTYKNFDNYVRIFPSRSEIIDPIIFLSFFLDLGLGIRSILTPIRLTSQWIVKCLFQRTRKGLRCKINEGV